MGEMTVAWLVAFTVLIQAGVRKRYQEQTYPCERTSVANGVLKLRVTPGAFTADATEREG
jgi:hypothetical protein